jgi:hypothetical protein
MPMLKKAALFCLLSFSCLTAFECSALPASVAEAGASAVKVGETAAEPKVVIPIGPDGMPLDASWEERYVKDTCTTIENNVEAVLSGLRSSDDLASSVLMLCRNWDDWAQSRLFKLATARDIDVYGNLYSFMVMCRTLRLAAEDWLNLEPGKDSQKVFNKALWLENRSRRLAEPVGEIIKNQSYSSFLPRRVEIMDEQFDYVDICYKRRPFSDVLR